MASSLDLLPLHSQAQLRPSLEEQFVIVRSGIGSLSDAPESVCTIKMKWDG